MSKLSGEFKSAIPLLNRRGEIVISEFTGQGFADTSIEIVRSITNSLAGRATITDADNYYRVRSGLFKSSLLQRRAFITLETSAKHHIPRATNISTFVDQTHIQRSRPRRKTVVFFSKLVFHCLKAARQDAAKKS